MTATARLRMGAETMRLSARNKISAKVTGITRGEATANMALDAGGVRLVASITVEAADELGLAEGWTCRDNQGVRRDPRPSRLSREQLASRAATASRSRPAARRRTAGVARAARR